MRMKSSLLRILLLFLVSVFVLAAFTGCPANDGVTNTQGNTESKGTEDNNAGDPPKEPISLRGYSIVIPDGTTDVSVEGLSAYELKQMLTEFGYSVKVKEDNGSATVDAKSILLGKTAATEGEMPEGNNYSIVEKNGQIQISAGNYYGYSAALNFIKSKIRQNDGFPQGLEYTGTADVSNVTRTGDSIRVMFYNVLGYSWEGVDGEKADEKHTPSVTLRQELECDLLSAYAPDVIGFQEYVNEFQSDFDAQLEAIGYTRVPTTKTNNNTPIFYRADKVTLVQSDFTKYTTTDSAKNNRGVTWAMFKENGTDKMFAVFNTHFLHSLDKNTTTWDTERENNAKQILAVINNIVKLPNIPIIMGGDLNFSNIWSDKGTESSRKPYEALVNGGLTLASNIEGVQTNFYTSSNSKNYTNSVHGFYLYDSVKKIYDMKQSNLINNKKSQYTLDHIFMGNLSSITVHTHWIVEDELTMRASDHCPVFVDFTIN